MFVEELEPLGPTRTACSMFASSLRTGVLHDKCKSFGLIASKLAGFKPVENRLYSQI